MYIDKETTESFLPQGKKGFCVFMAKRLHSSSMTAAFFRKEALIHSLSAFILEFLGNARNGMTQIVSYLRSPMTRQCIKIFMKADSMSGSVLRRGEIMKRLLKAVLTGSLLGTDGSWFCRLRWRTVGKRFRRFGTEGHHRGRHGGGSGNPRPCSHHG